jgi:hypothetical protein
VTPVLIEVPELNQATRLTRLARSDHMVGLGLPGEAELEIPGLAYRRVEDPVPLLDYGLAWLNEHESPFASAFIDTVRETVAAQT